MTGCCHFCIVEDSQFASTWIPLRLHDALHALNLRNNLLGRVMAAHFEGAGFHVRTIGLSVVVKVRKLLVNLIIVFFIFKSPIF